MVEMTRGFLPDASEDCFETELTKMMSLYRARSVGGLYRVNL